MTRLPAAASLLLLAAACADDAPPPRNPDKLWLALDGSEIQVRLVGAEPPPF
ncbi:MAG: hypothetical protein R3B06_06195 [Kofleriaceae bacterium]